METTLRLVVSFPLCPSLLLLFPECTVITRRFPSCCTLGFASVDVLLVVVLAATLTQLYRIVSRVIKETRGASSEMCTVSVCECARFGLDSVGSAQFEIFHTSWSARATLSRCSLSAAVRPSGVEEKHSTQREDGPGLAEATGR